LQFLGHDIIVCPVVVQNDPKLWPDANKFNPTRFSEREAASAKASNAADPNNLSRFDFLPFGHGRYSCPGNVFAMNEMLLFLSMMFHNFAMRLVNAIPSPDLTKMVNATSFRNIRAFSHSWLNSFPGRCSACCASFCVPSFSCFEKGALT
jgi:cytochrome P450